MTSTLKSSTILRRFRAERLLRSDFVRLRSQVLAIVRSRLRAQGVTLDHADLEACYAMAWQGLYATVLDGEVVDSPSAWLVLVTFRRAIDESRDAAHRRLAPENAPEASVDPDLAGSLDDRMKLQQVLEAMRARLSARECEAASLCYLQGFSRPDAAARMGIGEARMHKLMDGAGPNRPGIVGKVGALLDTIGSGGWCEQQSSLMRAHAFGILDPDGPRHALAVIHCRECPACRAHVAFLRGLAVVLPPLPTRLVLAGTVGAGSGTLASSGSVAGSPSVAAGGSVGVTTTTTTGWAGGVSSFAVKLAVVGAFALGVGGYVALAGPSHRGSPSSHAIGGDRGFTSAVVYPKLYTAHFGLPPTASAHRRSRLASSPHRARPRRRSASVGAAREFGPERVVASSSAIATQPPSGSQVRNVGASNEFGFE